MLLSPSRHAPRPVPCLFVSALLLVSATVPASGAVGDIETIIGTGVAGSSGDGGLATAATLRAPSRIAVDSGTGTTYIADTANHKIRQIDSAGVITTIAGSGTGGFQGDGGDATLARLNAPRGVALDGSGRVVIADTGNNRIRRIEADGTITTIGGNGLAGAAGDGGQATAARLNDPWAVIYDSAGALLIADHGNDKVRRVGTDGVISTIAGTGTVGLSGDAGPAVAAKLNHPGGLAIDTTGRLLIVDKGNDRIRRIEADGTINTIAGTTGGYSGDGAAATSAKLSVPQDVTVSASGVIYIADSGNHAVRRIDLGGVMGTVAGTGIGGYSGDGGPATVAKLRQPSSVLIAPSGALLILEDGNHVVRRVTGLCGDGATDPGEECDLGSVNGAPTSCCSATCTYRAAGEVCRALAGTCDVVETCSGSAGTCPGETVLTGGTECRASAGICDPAESCNGSAAVCPSDARSALGTECRASAGGCDPAEACDGTAVACPVDTLRTAGTECRAAAGSCDLAEACSGSSVSCPGDTLRTAGTVCRTSAGECDPEEICSGVVAACPGDSKASASTECRASLGACDPTELCTGSGNDCPADVFTSDTDSDTVCDPDDNCEAAANPAQDDGDTDGVGDVCDNCPSACNPDQSDSDGDAGGGDACDACPAVDQGATAPACAAAGPESALECCLPAGSTARAADETGDVCAGGGALLMTSSDGRVRLRTGAGMVAAPTTVSATAVTRGWAAAELGLPAGTVANSSLLRPEGESFAVPPQICLGFADDDADGVVDHGGPRTADLRLLAAPAGGGAAAELSPRCADMPCGTIDGAGFPADEASFDAWGGTAEQPVCCDRETGAICFAPAAGGAVALGAPVCAAGTGSLRMVKLDQGAGEQKLVLRGEVSFASSVAAGLDPVADGVRLRLLDGEGRSILAVTVPPGVYQRASGRGWTESGRGGSAKWRSKVPLAGIDRIDLDWDDARDPGQVSFLVKGKALALELATADLPLRFELSMGDADAFDGACGALDFGAAPLRGCVLNPGTGVLLCR